MNKTINKTIYGNKLAHYASREPKSFLQLDAFYSPWEDSALWEDPALHPDKDGDALKGKGTIELMQVAEVRVLIPHDAKPKAAVRQLKKIAKWLNKNPDLFDLAKPLSEEVETIPF